MNSTDGYVCLKKITLADAPGSSATVTLWTTTGDNQGGANRGARFKAIAVALFASHLSATGGLSFEESADGGTNWDVLITYDLAASTYTKRVVAVSAPDIRVRYTNNANVLTTFRGFVLGDTLERVV